MKIAILSSASAGGAGIAAFRIYKAFKENSKHEVDFFDINTFMEAVDQKVSPQISATNKKYTNTHFTVDFGTTSREWVVELLARYDVVNIHWASYLISLSEILTLAKKGTKVLFTLHDFYYVTGGCHYPAGCTGFLDKCKACPQLDSKVVPYETVTRNQLIKKEIFSYSNVLLAAPSKFIIQNAVDAGIVPSDRAYVLRNAYQPLEDMIEKDFSVRNILLIADSFDEKRKGLQLAVDSLKLASSEYNKQSTNLAINLHLVGGVDQQVISQLKGYPINVITHGHVKQHEKLIQIFQECHFILSCSYEDNWPNILVESSSYGCIPIVGKWHGCEEFVMCSKTGFVADRYTENCFSESIKAALLETREKVVENISRVHDFAREAHSYSRVVFGYECAILGQNKQCFDLYKPRVSVNYMINSNNINKKVLACPFGNQSLIGSTMDNNHVNLNSGYGLLNFEGI